MKRWMLLGMLLGCSMLLWGQDTVPDTAVEKAAIKETALNYIEGWYEGNVERMNKALHPDLVKRYMQTLPTGKSVTTTISKTTMIEYTRAAFGTRSPNKDKPNTVDVLSLDRNIASARCVSGDFYDYLQLVKTGDGWKIMNVLWTPVNPTPPRQ